jgi:uncharacterized protein (UPF0548 family)
MFSFQRPTESQIRQYLAAQAALPAAYDAVGCTRQTPAPRRGWNIDRERVLLGHGEAVFRRAKEALQTWQMFPREIATICSPAMPRAGDVFGVLYWAAPVRLWMLFPVRIVYLLDETTCSEGHKLERFGFASGTLAGHAECGEERFLVEWDDRDDSVWYELLAVSQPRHWLARWGYFYTRWEQARFRRRSCRAMQRATA